MSKALTDALEQLAGPGVAVAVQDASAPSDPVWAKERIAIARAVPLRLAEFTAGRAAARRAMLALGLPKAAIPVGPDRAPVWPAGVVGSISHIDGICAALVGRTGAINAIGLDLELNDPLDPDLWPEVCTRAELAALGQLNGEAQGQTARLIFSAKECCYKCIYPQTQTLLGFGAMEILVDQSTRSYRATLTQQAGPFAPGTAWHGGFALVAGLIATVMVHRQPFEMWQK